MYDGNMTNPATKPGTVQWYADMHSSACLLVQNILSGMTSLDLGSDEYDLMYSALTAANESARSLYDMFILSAKREIDASEAANTKLIHLLPKLDDHE